MKAVILAAGEGKRIGDEGVPIPKPLVSLSGIPLLQRVIETAHSAGASSFVVILGDRANQVQTVLRFLSDKYSIAWIHHNDWRKGNGSSLLAAQPHVLGEEHFLVLMADHLFFMTTLKKLMAQSPKEGVSTMAVDFKKGSISDLADATKVRIFGEDITKIGKEISVFDAIDIGASLCSQAIFEELHHAAQKNNGHCSHTEGMRGLASKKTLRWFDIGEDLWEDVDNLKSLQAAEKILNNNPFMVQTKNLSKGI